MIRALQKLKQCTWLTGCRLAVGDLAGFLRGDMIIERQVGASHVQFKEKSISAEETGQGDWGGKGPPHRHYIKLWNLDHILLTGSHAEMRRRCTERPLCRRWSKRMDSAKLFEKFCHHSLQDSLSIYPERFINSISIILFLL